MAPLTWRNVDAPDLGRASRILNDSAKMFGGAMDGLSDNLTGIRDRQKRDRSAEALPMLAKVANEQGANEALSQLGSMIDPKDMDAGLQEAMMNLRTQALGYENTRAGTDNTRAGTASIRGQEGRAQGTYEYTNEVNAQKAAVAGDLVENNQIASGNNFDWGRVATGGAASRPDSFSGLNPEYADRVANMVTAAEQELGEGSLKITSGFRDAGVQANIVADNMAKYGLGERAAEWKADVEAMGPEAAGEKWRPIMREAGLTRFVAMPGGSDHQSGTAVDFADANGSLLRDPNSAEAAWIRENAGRFGLNVPMEWEPWQVGMAEGGGQAGRPMNDISAILRQPGNVLTADDVMGNMETNSERRNATEDRNNDRVDRTESRAAAALQAQEDASNTAEAERLKAIQAEQDAWANQNYGSFGSDLNEVVRNIRMDGSMDPEVKEARIAAIQKIYEQDPEYFSFNPEEGKLPDGFAEAQNALKTDLEYSRQVDDATNTLASIMSSDDDRAPAGVLTDLNTSLEKANIRPINSGAFTSAVADASKKYGLPQSTVARIAENTLKEGGWGSDVEVDGPLIMARLEEVLGDRASFSRVRERATNLSNIQNQASEIETSVLELQAEAEMWRQEGKNPEVAETNIARINEALEKHSVDYAELVTEAQNAARTIDEERGRGGPLDNAEPPQPTDAEQAAAALAEAARVDPPDTTIPTPEGNVVDPTRSQAVQTLQTMARGGEIQKKLMNIRKTLGMSGAAAIPNAMGRVGDFFRDPETAQANQENRGVVQAAAEWFNSPQAEDLFVRNPQLLDEVDPDKPEEFWQKFILPQGPLAPPRRDVQSALDAASR